MFETVHARERRDRGWRNPRSVAASIGLHVAAAVAIATAVGTERGLPPVEEGPEETVAFMEVLRRLTPEVTAKRVGEGEDGYRAASAVPSAPPPLPSAPLDVPSGLPDLAPAELALRSVGILDRAAVDRLTWNLAGASNFRGLAEAHDSAGAETRRQRRGVVPMMALAERPQMVNEWQMQRIWRKLYPEELIANGIEGEAVVSFIISKDGRVEVGTVKLVRATHEGFAAPSVEGANRLRFRPAHLDGRPVRVRAAFPVRWRLPKT